ncbi:hypothetical protein QOZ80_4BG0348890 [Eleusine coracana subsp. coracana]|nr:hypothetical protein QOZ80_4BG0348890 [Eleusine coracana subsp. coracana]
MPCTLAVRLQVLAYHNNEPSFHTPSPGAWQIQAFHALGPSEVSEGWNFQQGQRKVAKLILQREFHPFGIPMFSIPLHCDGLVLISCITGKAFMCNPSTREFVELPPDSTNVASDHRVAFGFDPWSGDNNQAWEWKLTMDPPYPIKARTPICLSGSFYWSALQSMADDKGKLCYVHSATSWEIAIWLGDDGPNLTWSLSHRVNLPIPRSLLVFACASVEPDKILLSIDATHIF